MQLPIVVLTCDKYDWLLSGFAYLFNRYWHTPDQPVIVAGFRQPPCALPANFKFQPIAATETLSWCEHIRKFAVQLPDYFVLLLDDYWLCQPVEPTKLHRLLDTFIARKSDKADLSGNTVSFGADSLPGSKEFVIAHQHAKYRTSTQPAIWTKRYLLRHTTQRRSIWDFERLSGREARNDGAEIIAYNQALVPVYSYANVCRKGKADPRHIRYIKPDDIALLKQLGYADLLKAGGAV